MSKQQYDNSQEAMPFQDYHDIFMNAPMGIFTASQKGRLVSANNAMAGILGYESLQGLNSSITDIINDLFADPSDWEKCISPVDNPGEISRHECTLLGRDGSEVRVLISMRKVLNSNGDIIQYQGFVDSITQRRQEEDYLNGFNRDFLVVLESTTDYIYFKDRDRRIRFCSQAMARITGHNDWREVVGKNDFEIFPREKAEIYYHEEDQVLQDGIPLLNRVNPYIDENGRTGWALTNKWPVYDDENIKIVGLFGISRDITELKNAENALSHSYNLLRYVVEHTRSSVAVHDRNLNYIFVSQRYLDEFKVREEDVIGRHHYDVFPDLPRKWRDVHQKALEGEVLSAEDDPFYRDDGTVEWTRWECRPWYEHDGTIGGIIVYTEVITERKRMEEALRESEKKLNSLFSAMTEMVVLHELIFDQHGRAVDYRIIDCNQAFTKVTGIKREVAFGRLATEVYGENPPPFLNRYARVAVTGDPLIFSAYYQPMDKYFHVSVISPKDNQFATITTDITERKRAEEKLRRIEWMLSKKPDSGLNGQNEFQPQSYGDLACLNRDGIIKKYVGVELLKDIARDYLDLLGSSSAIYEVNGDYALGIFASGWCRTMDLASRNLCSTPDNIEALNSGRWLCHESCWTHCSKEAICRGKSVDIECNGGLRLFAAPVFAKGEVIGAISFGYGDPPKEPEKLQELAEIYGIGCAELERESNSYDSRPPYIIEMAKSRLQASARLIGSLVEARLAEEDREKLQSQLLRAQKMESMGILAGGIAHDFNNLLQTMRGNVDRLAQGNSIDERSASRLKAVDKSIERAAKLVQQLLLFGRKAEHRKIQFDINQEVREVVQMLKRTIPRMIAIELHLDPETCPIWGDPVQVEQVIFNLTNNAVDAMPAGGKLLIETVRLELDAGFVKMHPGSVSGPHVLLSITDTGCGMDDETLEHIYDPFFTTKEIGKGTGLGLASVYGIIKAHDGYISCYSEKGQGTTFRVYFPVFKADNNATEEQQPVFIPQGGSETVLIVDDEPEIRELTREILEEYGYKVIVAANGEEALEKHLDYGESIDLTLLDLNMPGMGGHKCLQEILKLDPSAKVIIASGYSPNGQAKETMSSGARAFIGKPYQLNKLVGTVRKVLDS